MKPTKNIEPITTMYGSTYEKYCNGLPLLFNTLYDAYNAYYNRINNTINLIVNDSMLNSLITGIIRTNEGCIQFECGKSDEIIPYRTVCIYFIWIKPELQHIGVFTNFVKQISQEICVENIRIYSPETESICSWIIKVHDLIDGIAVTQIENDLFELNINKL